MESNKEILETLKTKLFGVLAKDIKIIDFEQWLYTSTALLESIDKDPFVFNLYNLNYKSDTILKTIDNICKEMDGEEGYIISIVEGECRKILETENEQTVLDCLYRILEFHSFDNDFELLYEFYLLNVDIDMSIDGYGLILNHVKEAHFFANQVLNELTSKTIEEKKELLINGTGFSRKPTTSITKNPRVSVKIKKPWYQFWN